MTKVESIPLNVTIKVISIDNKKLTKSYFNQIEFGDCFDHNMDFSGDAIIGYVKDKDSRYLLWIMGGKLRRMGLKRYSELDENPERASQEKTEWFLRKTMISYTMCGDNQKVSDSIEEREKYIGLVIKTKKILKDLIDKQIYL